MKRIITSNNKKSKVVITPKHQTIITEPVSFRNSVFKNSSGKWDIIIPGHFKMCITPSTFDRNAWLDVNFKSKDIFKTNINCFRDTCDFFFDKIIYYIFIIK